MSKQSLRFRLALLLIGAFSIQAAIGGDIAIREARPDLALTTLLVSCLFVGANSGAALGTFLGLLEASYLDRFVGSIIVSRTLTGFAIGALEERIFRDSVLFAIAVAFLGTLAVEVLFYLFAPQPHALRWSVRALLSAAYNAGIAIPVYYGIRRLTQEPKLHGSAR